MTYCILKGMSNFTTMCYTGAVCLDDGEYKLIDLLDGTTCDIGKVCEMVKLNTFINQHIQRV